MITCYYCKEFDRVVELPDGQYFCNQTENDLWADKNYGKKGTSHKNLTIEEMQERLRNMGKGTPDKQKQLF